MVHLESLRAGVEYHFHVALFSLQSRGIMNPLVKQQWHGCTIQRMWIPTCGDLGCAGAAVEEVSMEVSGHVLTNDKAAVTVH